MKKEHSVFISIGNDELTNLVHKHFKKSGLLKDIPDSADRKGDDCEVCIEYFWEEEHEKH